VAHALLDMIAAERAVRVQEPASRQTEETPASGGISRDRYRAGIESCFVNGHDKRRMCLSNGIDDLIWQVHWGFGKNLWTILWGRCRVFASSVQWRETQLERAALDHRNRKLENCM